MFNEITASIDGRTFTLAYNARPVMMDRKTAGRARSARIRRVARVHKARYGIAVREAGQEVWYLSRSRAISFQTQLEKWLRGKPAQKHPFALVTTLDRAVYFAEVAEGCITAETVLVEGPALEKMNELAQAGTPVRWFAGGEGTLQLGGHRPEGRAPVRGIKVREHRYQPLALLMMRQRLYHPSQALAAGLAAGLILSGGLFHQFNEERQARRELELRRQQQALQAPAKRPIPRQSDFSASARIAELSQYYTLAEQLYSSGLTTLQYAQTATIAGATPDYPLHPIQVSGQAPWNLALLPGGGWSLTRGIVAPEDLRSAAEFKRFRMLEHIHYLAARSSARLTLTSYLPGGGVLQIDFTLSYSRPSADNLRDLARLLAGRPYRLNTARCDFADWAPHQCTLHLSAGTVEEET